MRGTLRSADEFSRVMRRGKTVTTPDLVIHTLDRDDAAPGRYGLVVSKKERGAVGRNRAKRQLRAAIRLAGGVPIGCDAVVVLKRGRSVDVESARRALCQVLTETGRESRQ